MAGSAAALILLLPGGRPAPSETLRAGPPAVNRARRSVHLTPRDRAAINETLDRFVPAAAGRRDPAAAWELAGPGLRAGSTRADWLAGRLPVFPFQARDTRFHGWQLLYSYRDEVGLDLLLQPRDIERKGAMAVSVRLARSGPRWLVDGWYPVALFEPPQARQWVTGPPDFAAGGWTKAGQFAGKPVRGRLDAGWLLLPAALLGLGVLVPLGLVLAASLRRRLRA